MTKRSPEVSEEKINKLIGNLIDTLHATDDEEDLNTGEILGGIGHYVGAAACNIGNAAGSVPSGVQLALKAFLRSVRMYCDDHDIPCDFIQMKEGEMKKGKTDAGS